MRWVGWLPLVRWERPGSPCCGLSGCGHGLQGTRPQGVAAPRLESAGSGAEARLSTRGRPRSGVEPVSPARAGGSRMTKPAGKPLGLFIFYLSVDTQHHVSFTCKTWFNIYIHEEVIGTVTLVTTRHRTKLLQCYWLYLLYCTLYCHEVFILWQEVCVS